MKPLIGVTPDSNKDRNYEADFFRIRPEYTDAVRLSGGIPIILPITMDENVISDSLSRLDGILLSGGGDIDPAHYQASLSPLTKHILPDRDEFEILLTRKAIEDRKPLLAVCRGHQLLNVALGGSLYQDLKDELGTDIQHQNHPAEGGFQKYAHVVGVEPDSLLSRVMDYPGDLESIPVNSLHHQGINDLAGGLRASAFSPDGLIEGVESETEEFILGVQWHPEALFRTNENMHNLFKALITAASQRQ